MGYTPDDKFMTIPRRVRKLDGSNGVDVKLDNTDNIPKTAPDWYPLHLWLKHLLDEGWLFISSHPIPETGLTAFIFRHKSTTKDYCGEATK